MKNIYVLGAAGSIGLQTLEIVEKSNEELNIIGMSLGSNDVLNQSIIDRFPNVEIICLRNQKSLKTFQDKYPNIKFVFSDQGLIEIAKYPKKGIVLNALSGSAGLRPTVAAIESKKDIALANKETLVMAGDIINQLIKMYHVDLYPVDSEHSALWQTLRGEDQSDIEKLVITASGGSFRDLSREALNDVTLQQALMHPNWSMGDKITIDSATMMNKGLEVIEAHHLFGLPYQKIETIIHKESVVHGLTYFKDGTVKASLSLSDMRIPIAYALYYPKRHVYESSLELTNLSFQPMDFKRFPLLELAFYVGKQGGLLPTVMNAANEAAVKLFLKEQIKFLDIEKIVMDTVHQFENKMEPTLDEIITTDELIQNHILLTYGKR
ncbi:MAG: 1-deoxy-D-xylulose-5-phosphate reductoisomerase [Tenericutes bacterium]|nr:1-deoxy-D-xylulose-5-phosphate reductoisomerase [Mycoplasmatota bacterium]